MEQRGHSVVISHFNFCDWGWHILFSQPDIVVVPWMRYDINVARFFMFRRSVPKIVNLQWEQVYSQKGIESGLVTIQGAARKCCHLCWGIWSKQRLLREQVAEKNIFINGPLHFDLCRPEFVSYFMPREELAEQCKLRNDKKWILYISSFSFATLREDQLKGIEKQIGTSYGDFVQITKENRELTLNWIEDFLKKNSNREFIYRPHPAEHADSRLLEMQTKYPNFHVITLFSVKQWILCADRTALWISTSLGELSALGKNCAIVRPKPLSSYYDVEYMTNAETISTQEDFESYLFSDSEENKFPISRELLKEYYDHDPVKTAYSRTADILEKIYTLPGNAQDFDTPEVRKNISQLRSSVAISLFVSLYERIGLSFSKVIPINIFKRIDCFLQREKIRFVYERNIGKLFSGR